MVGEGVMRICFVSKGEAGDYLGGQERADVVLCGFNGKKEISYEKELKGESTFFEEIARLSKENGNIVCHGCVTNTRGHKRKSAVLVENGRILGVSDMLHVVDGEVGSGSALRVYDTGVGRIGLVVAEDIRFPEVIKTLAICGSDFILCPFGAVDELQSVLLRANAYFYGVPILFCGEGKSMLADADGKLVFSSPSSPIFVDFTYRKEYHLVETRRRGFFRSST